MEEQITIKSIVTDWLKKHGYAGLCNPRTHCGCSLNDLMCCEGAFDDDPKPDCVPAMFMKCSDDCEFQGEWCDGPDSMLGGGCWTTAVRPQAPKESE